MPQRLSLNCILQVRSALSNTSAITTSAITQLLPFSGLWCPPDCKLQYAMAHSAEKNDRNGKLLHSTMAVKFYFTVARRYLKVKKCERSAQPISPIMGANETQVI